MSGRCSLGYHNDHPALNESAQVTIGPPDVGGGRALTSQDPLTGVRLIGLNSDHEGVLKTEEVHEPRGSRQAVGKTV